ncbi:N-succinylarginine dihydrolase [Sandaracinobacteroides sp. A072]|uniref:N-succinylarginine dihydrolase n=1 Tax=Sandaracinobacteroides sp. A072 TaxID=3461146 RepID=UPI0040431E45
MPELNLDGLVGPTHNYAGLSLGNLAATSNAGQESAPRKAALQGLAKMRLLVSLGVPQGLLLPHRRPNTGLLRAMGFGGIDAEVAAAAAREDAPLLAAACSASAMWTANAATVSPAADTADGRTHLTVANLATMAHRAQEWPETLAQLRLAFADRRFFAVHGPVPPAFGDEGAANHMRLCSGHEAPGLEVFVHGENRGGRFPARQHPRASQAVARKHGVDMALFTAQAARAIEAGAFHNDVVAVANETVLFAHEAAFENRTETLEALAARVPGFTLVEAPEAEVPLADAIASYVFNAALVSLGEGMALILPAEARETPSVSGWLDRVVADPGNPIGQIHVLDLRESMRNGGGPACLRLRVALPEEAHAAIDPRFLLDDARLDRLERLVERYWPERIAPSDLSVPQFWADTADAHAALLAQLGIAPEELGLPG